MFLRHLRLVLEPYRSANMQLRRDKCKFACSETEFLGHLLSKDGYQPLPSLVAKIKCQPRPWDLKDSNFIPNMSAIALPLYRLTMRGYDGTGIVAVAESYLIFCKVLAQNLWSSLFPTGRNPFIWRLTHPVMQ